MSTVKSILDELSALGRPSIKKVLSVHGAREPFFGVRIGDMKPIVKRIGKDYDLSLGLYATGNSDAMYLAGLIADDPKMTKTDLNAWVEQAYWPMLSESTVPWVATGSLHGFELALDWIESDVVTTACAGWCTLSCLASHHRDEDLELATYKDLLIRVAGRIHSERNRVRYSMNNFVIACGSYLIPLSDFAIERAQEIGAVSVDMGKTSCGVPLATDYIQKVIAHGSLGKKRKKVKC